MKFKDFIKYYYKQTLSCFPDKSREQVHGIEISKKNRKFSIISSYLILLICIILIFLCLIHKNLNLLIWIFVLAFFSLVVIWRCDFNLVTVLKCYKIYNKNDIYSKCLKKHWFYVDDLVSIIKNQFSRLGKKVKNIKFKGLDKKFAYDYIIVFDDDIELTFKARLNKIIIIYNEKKQILRKNYERFVDLFDDIEI
jgi:hypothetical protein